MAAQNKSHDQIVYLLQGGGALGSYQVGVCESLLESGCHPNWIVGTSIGAINGAIIAGNKPENRIPKLHEFWNSITFPYPCYFDTQDNFLVQEFQNHWYAQLAALFGLPNFFKPRIFNLQMLLSSTPDKISFYDTSELYETLKKVIDFDLINQKKVRLTLGAVRIKAGRTVYFDNYCETIGPQHIMASSALPPGFPAIKIDDEYYWDGGLSSNTPFAVLLEEKAPQKLLCIIVNLFSFPNYLPSSLLEVYKYKKELEFASRHQRVLHYFSELHFLQHSLHELGKTRINHPELEKALNKIKKLGHPTALNIARFHYRDRQCNLWSKDYNFSHDAIREHWKAGLKDAEKALQDPSWMKFVENASGAVIHEF